MISNGIPINIILIDDGCGINTTSYCGTLSMFSKENRPDFIVSVNFGENISVCIHRADMSKLLSYIREFGVSLVKQF
jgi:hypothetical protein